MYQHFYRLKADPFRLSPDHNFCYRHPSFARGRAYMKYALTAAEGFVVVTGKPGMGKTTLINDLLAEVGSSDYLAANVVTTTLEANDLLRAIAYEFGLPVQGLDKATVIQELKKLFVFSHQTGRPPLLIVDEAQNLTLTALEELRLLTNLNFDNRPLLQIFLLGQDELRHKLQDPQLEQLRQRVTAAARLEPLTAAETKAYVVHRLRIVGWNNFPQIDIAILPVLHGNTEGIPRRINQFCNRLLLLGAAEEKHRLTAEDARLVARELSGEGLTQPAASAPVDDDTDPIGEDCFGAELFTAPPVTPEPAPPATPTDEESPPAAAAPEAAPPAPSIERAEPSGRPAAGHAPEPPATGLRNPQQDPRDPPMGPPIRLRPAAPPPPTPAPPEQTPQAPSRPAVARATAPRASRPPPDPGGPPNTGSRRPAFEDDLDRPPRRPHRVAIGVALAALMVAGLLYLGSHIHLDAWTGNRAAPAAPATTADITPPPTAVPSPSDATTASEMPTQTVPPEAPEATDTLAGSNTPLRAEVPLADHATAEDTLPPTALPVDPDDAPANPHVGKLLEQNIKGEQCAISVYKKLIDYTKDKDPVTYDIALQILQDEIEHEEDLEAIQEDIQIMLAKLKK